MAQTTHARLTRTAVRARDLVKVYGSGDTQVRALDGITLDIQAPGFTAVMGPSGSGKSTLMHCLAGLDSPTSGQIVLGDIDLAQLKDTALTKVRRERLSFVFQSFNLLPTLTAEQNVKLPAELSRRKINQEWYGRVLDVLAIQDRLRHRPSELSGGQQQRVAIARALVTRPEVVFADEPTGNLDSRAGAEVLGFLRLSVRELGQTVVMVTHDPIAATYADRVLFLADGRLGGELTDPSADAVLDALRTLGS